MLAFWLSLLMLSIAARQDLKKREVSDETWYAFSAIGATWLVLSNYPSIISLSQATINIGLTIILMYTIHEIGKRNHFFYIGGGDLKAIMALAVLNWQLPWTALATVFLLSLTLVLTVPAILLSLNLTSKPRVSKQLAKHKTALYLLGRKMKITAMTNAFYTPLETVTLKNGRETRKLTLEPDLESEKTFKKLKRLAKQGKIKNSIWVSPLLPHLIFIILAYTATILFNWNVVNIFI